MKLAQNWSESYRQFCTEYKFCTVATVEDVRQQDLVIGNFCLHTGMELKRREDLPGAQISDELIEDTDLSIEIDEHIRKVVRFKQDGWTSDVRREKLLQYATLYQKTENI